MRSRISLKVLFCLGLSLFLSSCGSKRQVHDSAIDSKLIGEIETIVDEIMTRRVIEIKRSDIRADILITDKRFDTDGEIDPSTGERPLVSRTDAHIVIGRRDSVMTADSLGVDKTASGVTGIDSETSVKSREEDSGKETRWPVAIISISVLGSLVVLFVMLKKLKILK